MVAVDKGCGFKIWELLFDRDCCWIEDGDSKSLCLMRCGSLSSGSLI